MQAASIIAAAILFLLSHSPWTQPRPQCGQPPPGGEPPEIVWTGSNATYETFDGCNRCTCQRTGVDGAAVCSCTTLWCGDVYPHTEILTRPQPLWLEDGRVYVEPPPETKGTP